MRLMLCKKCGNKYNGDIWYECPTCTKRHITPQPYSPVLYPQEPIRIYRRRDTPINFWDEDVLRGKGLFYILHNNPHNNIVMEHIKMINMRIVMGDRRW